MEETLVDQIEGLKRKIQTLEWDKKLGQITFSKASLLDQYKERLNHMEEKIKEDEKNA